MQYTISVKQFLKHKAFLDGLIMWREADNKIEIMQIWPNRAVADFLRRIS